MLINAVETIKFISGFSSCLMWHDFNGVRCHKRSSATEPHKTSQTSRLEFRYQSRRSGRAQGSRLEESKLFSSTLHQANIYTVVKWDAAFRAIKVITPVPGILIITLFLLSINNRHAVSGGGDERKFSRFSSRFSPRRSKKVCAVFFFLIYWIYQKGTREGKFWLRSRCRNSSSLLWLRNDLNGVSLSFALTELRELHKFRT